MALVTENDEAFNPLAVHLPGADAEVLQAYAGTHTGEQPGAGSDLIQFTHALRVASRFFLLIMCGFGANGARLNR
jgi:hypothetical protein